MALLCEETEMPVRAAHETARISFHSEPKMLPPSRSLLLQFRRDPARDQIINQVEHVGFQILWPDGKPVALGIESFCCRGQRLLGLDRQMKGFQERLIELLCFQPLSGDDDIIRLPGYRVRRFILERTGTIALLYFMNGVLTDTRLDLMNDDERILDWVDVRSLKDGERRFVDIVARASK